MPTGTDLTPYQNKYPWLRKTADQISKDFTLAGEELEIAVYEDDTFDDLVLRLQPVIASMLERQSTGLFNLLYRIDISETQISRALAGHEELSPDALLSRLMVERELLKVVIRHQYSSNNSSEE